MTTYTPRRGDRIIVTFNATGGSNRTPWRIFATWWDDLVPGDRTPDVGLVCEADGFHDVLVHLGHVTVAQAPAGVAGHGRREVAVITKRTVVRVRFVQLTRFVRRRGPKKLLWHDRHLAGAVVGTQRRTLNYSTHVAAMIQDRQSTDKRLTKNPGALEWVRHGRPTLRAELTRAMRRNRCLRVGLDGNQVAGTAPENLAQLFTELGMAYRNVELMWFAWNAAREELVHFEVLATPPGSDGHPTLVAVLRRIPLTRRIRNRKEHR